LFFERYARFQTVCFVIKSIFAAIVRDLSNGFAFNAGNLLFSQCSLQLSNRLAGFVGSKKFCRNVASQLQMIWRFGEKCRF
jgi:hypothetical protein